MHNQKLKDLMEKVCQYSNEGTVMNESDSDEMCDSDDDSKPKKKNEVR